MTSRAATMWMAMVLAGAAAGTARAQSNPGLSTKPAMRALGEKANTPASDQTPDLSHDGLNKQTSSVTLANFGRISLDEPSGPPAEEKALLEAANKGNPVAQTQLAKIYLQSPDHPERLAAAVSLLKLAAEQKNAEAIYELGALAMAGRGVPQSASAAFAYCQEAAEMGYGPALYQLAALYALGRGTSVDEEQAIYWGRKSIAEGNPKAKYSVGRLLLLRGETRDQNEAVALLEEASGDGIAEAAIELAAAFAQGTMGLNQDVEKAKALLAPHADKGNEAAAEALQKLGASPKATAQ